MQSTSIEVTVKGLEEAAAKAAELTATMQKAKSLADDLARMLKDLEIHVEV